MTGVLVCYVVGFVVGGLVWWSCRAIFDADVFMRENYRGHRLPTAVGAVLPVSVALVVALRQLIDPPSGLSILATTWQILVFDGPVVVGLAVAFGILGLIDDVAGVGQSGGFRGHLRALTQGRMTTGLMKMIGGPIFALAVLAGGSIEVNPTDRVGLIRDAVLIALAANLANLLDRAPGRVNKVIQLAGIALALATRNSGLGAIAVVLGAGAALMIPDLREQAMLGDTGSNVLGAVLGFGIIESCTPGQRWIVAGALLLANAASELVSFTNVIDRVAPLRWFDRLGAPHR